MSEITVIARMVAKKDKEKELEAALRTVVIPTHQEPGCLRYVVHRCIETPSLIVVVERWISKAALDEHLQTPHIQTLFSKAPALVEAPPEILTYESINEGSSVKGRLS